MAVCGKRGVNDVQQEMGVEELTEEPDTRVICAEANGS